ncbi:MAG: hypothetical protein LCH39_08955 [Proteobacteria bacterium]|nr:hypothetical protein [Pseudomonadota bacterium]
MKKIVAFALALAFAVGSFASFSPASADPHKQNFQKRCPPNSNSCS